MVSKILNLESMLDLKRVQITQGYLFLLHQHIQLHTLK